jgi:uncharacterized protein
MLFTDRLTLDAPRKVQGGFLAVRARAARTGVYQYGGRDVDPDNKHGHRDTAIVNVLRDADTVFDERAVRSFIGKPVTDDHPSESVTSDNWRDHARGTIMGAMRDGEYLAFDLLLMDQGTIDKVNAGKRELSNGYVADLEFGDFTGPDGTKCQARQTKITDGNHVALVKYGRAGGDCAIKDDFAICDALPHSFLDGLNKEKPVKTMLIDGLTVDIANADTAQATITTILAARDAATAKVADLQSQVATLTTEGTTKDAKITTLEQQVKDAKPTTAQLRDAAKAYALVCDKAKALGVQFAEDADSDAIMKTVVDAKMGDAAKDWDASQIAASFAVLAKDAKPADPVRDLLRDGIRQPANGQQAVEAQRRRWLADKANGFRTQAA